MNQSLDHKQRHSRKGAASLEVVMVTALTLPLAVLMFLLGVKICSYVFAALSGTLSMPLLVITL